MIRLALLVLAVIVPAFAAPEIPLEKVGSHIGKEVEVVAEVKSWARSPHSKAVYLNFGDAYPRQTLTARVDPDHPEVLRGLPMLYGRTVRIRGTLETTKSGPTIVLTAPEQIAIVAVAPADLEEAGEGRAYRVRLATAVQAMLDAKDYDGLEAIARRWRKPTERTLDGLWKLDTFYEALGLGPTAPAEEFARRFAQLDAWAEARPTTVTPVIAAANLLLDLSWAVRREGTGERDLRLAEARRILDAIWTERNVCPQWHAAMLLIALREGWSPEASARLFAEAVAREPEYLRYYFVRAAQLQPAAGGRPGEWEEFSRSLPGEFGIEMQARIPWSVDFRYRNVFRQADIRWKDVQAGFEVMRRKYPLSLRNPSQYALMAAQAEDRATCRRLLGELGSGLDVEPWVTWENVTLTQRWLADPTASVPITLGLTPPRDPR